MAMKMLSCVSERAPSRMGAMIIRVEPIASPIRGNGLREAAAGQDAMHTVRLSARPLTFQFVGGRRGSPSGAHRARGRRACRPW